MGLYHSEKKQIRQKFNEFSNEKTEHNRKNKTNENYLKGKTYKPAINVGSNKV